MLHKEEAGLTTDRSLDGAPPEVQTFQIFVTGEWRTSFDKIKDALVGAGEETSCDAVCRRSAVCYDCYG